MCETFNFEKGVKQGDPGSTYLFILYLEIAFTTVTNNEDIRSKYLRNTFLHTAFADNTTFFFKRFWVQ